MKTINKALAVAGVTASIATAGFWGLGAASAANSSTARTDPMSSLVQAIATKFKLNTSDVQAVFDEQRTVMDTQREADFKTELAQLVTDGKLTQKQADAINAKRAELQAERESNRTTIQSSTETERKAHMETERAELDAWLTEQSIDDDYAYLLKGRGHGPGGAGGPRGVKSSTSTNTSTATN